MHTIFPPTSDAPQTTIDDAYGTALGLPHAGVTMPDGRTRPFVYINMVATVDGKATSGTKVAGIGSQTDKRAMRLLRAASDAVINGAETIRRENFVPDVGSDLEALRIACGQSPLPYGIVVSRRGELPLDKKFFTAGVAERLVITTEAAGAAQLAEIGRVARVIVVPRVGEDMDLATALATLYAQYGIRRVLLEGGPTLNYAFIKKHLVDELFLTVAPKIFGGDKNLTIVTGTDYGFDNAAAPRLELHTIYSEGSELFTRWRVTYDS